MNQDTGYKVRRMNLIFLRRALSSYKEDSGSFGAMMQKAWRKYHKTKLC
jgi:hypothetical protein